MWHEFLKRVVDLAIRHPGKALGAALGLLVGLLVILFGVLRALFLIACVIGGLYVGALVDGNGDARSLILRSRQHRRWGK